MANSNLLINNFNSGEVSGLIESRSDIAKYAAACKTLENAIPLVEGGAKKMSGSYFAGATANGGAAFTGSVSGTTLTVVVVLYGRIQLGQTVSASHLPVGLTVQSFGTGTGGTGTYILSGSATFAFGSMQTASNGKSRLVPFQFSTIQGAILEFSAGIVRIWEGASQGSWSLGLALQVPTTSNYNPATAYVPGNVVLIGPYFAVAFIGGTPVGTLYISAPYGTTNANTIPITFSVNTSDSLLVTVTGTSPNQGINVALANTTQAKNAANLIEVSIQALGSLNSFVNNYVNLTQWTVTPDGSYFGTPWITAPTPAPPGSAIWSWINENWIGQCVANNQNDEFPFIAGLPLLNPPWNLTFWQPYVASTQPIELATPYLEGDLFALDCSTQSADVLWVFHPNYPPAVIERLSANSWQYSLSLPGQQPNEPAYRGTLGVVKTGFSALGQNISLISQSNPCIVVLASSASSLPFDNGDRIYINLGAGMVELNQGEFLVSGLVYGPVSITVVDSTGTSSVISATGWNMNLLDPNTSATIDSTSYLQYQGGAFAVQVIPMFSAVGDYPACGSLYQERLFAGGSFNNPTQLNGSVQDDYPDFICDPNEEDFGVQFTLVSNQVNQLLNMIGTPNALLIGTSGGVWVVSGATGASLSQTNVNSGQQSTQGVSALQPQLVNGSAVFVSRSSRIVSFLVFNFVTNAWDNTDLTRLNRNITIGTSEATSGIAQTAFQMEPYPIFWAVRNDGQLIGLVFNTQDQVYAWFRINMQNQGGFIESVAVITGQGQEDQIVVVVNRTINGVTQRYVEYFMPQELFHQLSNAFFVNSGLRLQLLPAVNITGIANAPGASVTAPAHGFSNGMHVQITGVLGMTQINQNALQAYTVTAATTNTFQLAGMDSTSFGVYTGGGTVKQVTNQVTGMSYLLGQTVTAVGDQQVIFNGTVTADTVVFGSYANQIAIGLPYQTTIQPMNPVLGSQQATSKGKKQKFTVATFSLYESIGGQAGTDTAHLYDLSYGPNAQGNPAALFTGNITRNLDGEWGDEDTIMIVHSDPYPFTLRGVVPRLSVAEEG